MYSVAVLQQDCMQLGGHKMKVFDRLHHDYIGIFRRRAWKFYP